MKECAICKNLKTTEEFHTIKRKGYEKTYLHSYCISCEREYDRNRNRDLTEKTRIWRQNLTEEQRAAHRQVVSNRQRYKKYGVTISELQTRLKNQHGTCAICLTSISLEARAKEDALSSAHVDHNHTTGQVRGILCRKCNHALGLVREDPSILHSMLNYLKAYSE